MNDPIYQIYFFNAVPSPASGFKVETRLGMKVIKGKKAYLQERESHL